MENNIQQRTVNLQPTVVVNKAQFPEAVHKVADPRAGGADHFRQHLLTHLGNHTHRFAVLTKMSEQQKDPGQPLFTRIKKLINQIFFVTNVPRQQICHERVGKRAP